MTSTRLLLILLGVFVIARTLNRDSHGQTLAARLTHQGANRTAHGAPDASIVSTATNIGADLGSQIPGHPTLADLTTIAHKMGWGGSQISDWAQVIADESGGNPNSVNSSTTRAYGIGQFFSPAPGNPVLSASQQLALNREKYFAEGGNPNTIMGQLEGMANYIRQRYGTPAAALQHESTYHNY